MQRPTALGWNLVVQRFAGPSQLVGFLFLLTLSIVIWLSVETDQRRDQI